jgi:hypothetical protein
MALAKPATEATSEADYDLLATDLEAFAAASLDIRTKKGPVTRFEFNRSQRLVHERLEHQLAETGMVRALVLKGRKQGISTMVGARFYHKITNRTGCKALVLAHKADSTSALFEMVDLFHTNCPDDLKPTTGADSTSMLDFPELRSGYRVGTAGGFEVGRGDTFQYFHGSEFGFWPRAEANLVGAMEAVGEAEQTEIILESTANKPGDAFHRMWKAAKAGKSKFIAIFLPWFVHEEYATEPPEGWSMPEAFVEYQILHGLTDAQVHWAWSKNRDMASVRGLSADELCAAFKREYPATDDEAFEAAGDDLTRVIPRDWIKKAQARWIANKEKPLKPMTGMGLDVAQGGEDRTVLAPVHGLRFEALIPIAGALTTDGPAVAAAVLRYSRNDPTIAIDLGGGWGGGALSHLKQLNQYAIGVNPSEGSDYIAKDAKGDELFKMRNMRAELYWSFHDALNPESGEEVELPPDEELVEELVAAGFEITASGLLIESKKELVKPERLGRSPDKADAVLLGWHATKHNATRVIQGKSYFDRINGG